VAFRWPGGGPYPAGVTFVKVIAGIAGDEVTRADRDFFVNGAHVGEAKSVSREGAPLELGPTGVLPPGRYYVRAPHPDSLDSRYRLTGWISEEQIIGRAYALF
jgi:conjugal transfer pilin signal peptidase TrbI